MKISKKKRFSTDIFKQFNIWKCEFKLVDCVALIFFAICHESKKNSNETDVFYSLNLQ